MTLPTKRAVATPLRVALCHIRIYLCERDDPLRVILTSDSYRELVDAFRQPAPAGSVITVELVGAEGRNHARMHLRLDEVQAVIEEAS